MFLWMAEEAMMHRRIFWMNNNRHWRRIRFSSLYQISKTIILNSFIHGELSWLESRQVCTETSGSAPLPEENIWVAFRVFRLSTTTWVT